METVMIPVLAALLLCAVAALILILFLVLIPMKRLTRLSETAQSQDPEALRTGAERIGGTPGKAAQALIKACENAGEKQTGDRSGENEAAEERYRTAVVDGICESLLPQPLKNRFANMRKEKH